MLLPFVATISVLSLVHRCPIVSHSGQLHLAARPSTLLVVVVWAGLPSLICSTTTVSRGNATISALVQAVIQRTLTRLPISNAGSMTNGFIIVSMITTLTSRQEACPRYHF